MSGYAQHVIARYQPTEKDVLLVVSTSGINAFPIEIADEARKRGTKVIVISSLNYMDHPARTVDGRHLPDAGDLVINNHVPCGDATVSVRSDGTKAGPVSTIASVFISNSIMLSACEAIRNRGGEPEVYLSGNISGGDKYNKEHMQRFLARIRHL